MKKRKKNDVAALLRYAGGHKGLTFLGLVLSGIAMLLSMAPYICIWLAARDLIAVAPDWTQAESVAQYGWLAFAFAVGGIVIYFLGLMCTHLAAFRTASNIRKQGVARAILKDAPIVVLDEATAFADPENEVLIQKAFATLTKGRTVIMIAHRLSTVVGADKIIVLEEGRVAEQGTHKELTAAGGLYARMWADYNRAVQWKITSEKEAM